MYFSYEPDEISCLKGEIIITCSSQTTTVHRIELLKVNKTLDLINRNTDSTLPHALQHILTMTHTHFTTSFSGVFL